MADQQTEEVRLVKIPTKDTEATTTQEGDSQQPAVEKKFHKYDSKWEIIDKIKASEEQTVVINIFKVHPEATWKEIKEAYKEFHMKIEKVASKEGMFNLHFHNHNDAINFIKVSPKPILDKKFTMRLNERIRPSQSGGWNEMGADGHTAKFETMKYYKQKGTKKPFNKRTEEGEQEETTGAEQKPEGEEGLELPVKSEEKPAHREDRPKRFIGGRDNANQDNGFGHRNREQKKETVTAPAQQPAAEKPVVVAATVATKQPAQSEEWNTVKDVAKEKKSAEEAKKKAEKLQKEKEVQEKKAQEAKATKQAEKVAVKKPAADFTDGW